MTNPVIQFSIAILLGALVGIERERRKMDEAQKGLGGIRTFILFSMSGALAGWLTVQMKNPWIFAVAGLVVGGTIISAYFRAPATSVGITTEIAGIIVFLLGGTVIFGYPEVAVALGIATSAILAYKRPLHGIVERIGEDDIYAVLKLLIATFIILPILPNRTIDPWNALNPYKMWWLVILISSLSLVGYVASRWLGTGRGNVITGLFGGLVSSTAVTLSFAKQSKEKQAAIGSLASGLILAWSVMFFRVVIEVAVVHPPLVSSLAIPFSMMGVCAGAIAWILFRRSTKSNEQETGEIPLKNPFSLTAAVKFALLFAAVLLVVALVETYLSGRQLYLVAALAGISDVDAITLSMAEYAKKGGNSRIAIVSIVIASLTNTVVKCGLVIGMANPEFRKRVVVSTVVILLVAIGSLFLL